MIKNDETITIFISINDKFQLNHINGCKSAEWSARVQKLDYIL